MIKEIKYPLYLAGLMGAGKSSIGELLAKKLDLKFIDLDVKIAESEQKTLTQIFAENSETYFRDLEYKYLNEIVEQGFSGVVSLGGGSLIHPQNFDICQKGTLIYLKSDLKVLAARLLGDLQRPLLKNCKTMDDIEEKLRDLLQQRPQYEKCPFQISIAQKNINEITEDIISRIENENIKS